MLLCVLIYVVIKVSAVNSSQLKKRYLELNGVNLSFCKVRIQAIIIYSVCYSSSKHIYTFKPLWALSLLATLPSKTSSPFIPTYLGSSHLSPPVLIGTRSQIL